MGEFPLSLAIQKGHLEVVRLLLGNGADPDIPDRVSVFSVCCKIATDIATDFVLEMTTLLLNFVLQCLRVSCHK